MFQCKIRWGFVIVFILIIVLLTIQTLAASPAFDSPPDTVEVEMYRLVYPGGNVHETTPEVPDTCATPVNQTHWGCTAFDELHSISLPPGIQATVVPYPYGNTLTTEVSFEADYLMDVIPQEMSVGPANSSALQAQAVAARTYAMYKVLETGGELNNSTQNQAFIPYRFDFLRVEGGDSAHDPQTTPTPDVSDCSTIPATGVTGYQREACDAVSETDGIYMSWYANGGWSDDSPAFTEFFADVPLHTTPYPTPGVYPWLAGVEDPISQPDPNGNAVTSGHGHGLSTHGAIRWSKGDSYSYGGSSPWPVTWNDYRQILVHYYTGIDIGYDTGTQFQPVAPPGNRWNLLDYNHPVEMENNQDYTVTLVVQNTSLEAWTEIWGDNVDLTYRWTAPGMSPYDDNNDAWQTAMWNVLLAIGETGTLNVTVTAPNDVGNYDLHWDFVRRGEGSTWFGAPPPSWAYYGQWPHFTLPVTVTSIGTATPTATPTDTPTPTPTFTPSATPTPTNTPTSTSTPTATSTPTPVTPTPTQTPCVAQAAMQDASKDSQALVLSQLYQIRDEFLAKDENGQVYIGLYYRYSPELTGLLLKDSALRDQTRTVLEEMVPLSESLTNAEAKPLVVTKEQMEAMDKVLVEVQTQASPDLAKEIEWWREQIKNWPGLTAKEIWDKTGYLR